MYEIVRNGTNGNADFLLNFFFISMTIENPAARKNAAIKSVRIFQNPRKLPMMTINILSPYPNDSFVALLIIRKMTPTQQPEANDAADCSLTSIAAAAQNTIPESRTDSLILWYLISITVSMHRYPANTTRSIVCPFSVRNSAALFNVNIWNTLRSRSPPTYLQREPCVLNRCS